MIQNAQRLVDRTRRYLQDTAGVQQGNTFSDVDLVDLLNEEQDALVAKMVEGSEDYFAAIKTIAFAASQNVYPLFDGTLFLRKLDFLGGVSGGTQEAGDVIESRLIEGATSPGGTATPDQSQYFYAVFGDDLHIQPTPNQALDPALQAYIVRDPGPILLGLITPVNASNVILLSTDAPYEDDIMVGTRFHIVAGAGINQRRRVTTYVGATRQATFDTPFSPAPDATSKFASESRIVRLFHHLLAIGAAIRAKVILQEAIVGLTALYAGHLEDFEDFVYRARTYAQRSVTMVDYDVI